MTILLLDNIVSNTSSNSEGSKLELTLDNYIKLNKQVILRISSEKALSTSFLNSSLGILIEKHGSEKFKNFIKIKSNKVQFEIISNYVSKYSRMYS